MDTVPLNMPKIKRVVSQSSPTSHVKGDIYKIYK